LVSLLSFLYEISCFKFLLSLIDKKYLTFSENNYCGNLLIFTATLASTNAIKCYQCTDCAAEAIEDDLSECASYLTACYITEGNSSRFFINFYLTII